MEKNFQESMAEAMNKKKNLQRRDIRNLEAMISDLIKEVKELKLEVSKSSRKQKIKKDDKQD